MVSTTTFSMGDEIMVASTVAELAPPSYKLCPMGATQLAHTPRGTPVIAPSAVLAAALRNRRRGNRGSSVNTAAPKNRLNVMPMRFVHIQLMVVCSMRVASGMVGATGILASKLSTPLVLMAAPLCNFLRSAG